MYFQIIAVQSGARTKSIINKTETEVLTNYVIPFVRDGILNEKWGNKSISYQVLELKIYKTINKWDKKSKTPLETFVKGSKNTFKMFEKKASQLLTKHVEKVFVVTPIQGKEAGNQEEQRIHYEYNKRFECIESLLQDFNCVAIRIDKEFTIKNLAERIRSEIRGAKFVIADLTDERPSCYY